MMPQMLDQYVYLNTFLKIYERSIKDQFIAPLEVSFSPMVSIIEKEYVAQHVVTRLVEKWREDLDEKFVKDAVLTDLSKAFDCIKHDLLIAKRTAFGFSDTALNFMKSWKQGVCIISNTVIIKLHYRVYLKVQYQGQYFSTCQLMICCYLCPIYHFIIFITIIHCVLLQSEF